MTCEIEANIACCDGCRKKVTKYLLGIRGVESVKMYPEENKVIVTGNVDSKVLLHEVRRVKSEAQHLIKEVAYPVNKTSAIVEYGGGMDYNKDMNQNKKMKKKEITTSAVVPVSNEASQEATTVYNPRRRSRSRGEIAAESRSYGLNVDVYGIGAGVNYRRDVIYK